MAAMAQLYCQPRYAALSNAFKTHDSLPPIRKRSHSLTGGYIPHCYRHLVLDSCDDEGTEVGSEAGEREYDDDDDYDSEWSEQVPREHQWHGLKKNIMDALGNQFRSE